MLHIQAGRTPSLAYNNDKVLCALLLDAIGKTLAHPKSVAYICAHLWPLLDTVLANIMSENKDVPGNDNEDFDYLF